MSGARGIFVVLVLLLVRDIGGICQMQATTCVCHKEMEVDRPD